MTILRSKMLFKWPFEMMVDCEPFHVLSSFIMLITEVEVVASDYDAEECVECGPLYCDGLYPLSLPLRYASRAIGDRLFFNLEKTPYFVPELQDTKFRYKFVEYTTIIRGIIERAV